VLLVGMVDVVLVYLVRVTLQAGGVWYGVAEASWMVGMVGGAVGAGVVGTDRRRVRATVAGIAVACAGVAAFAVALVLSPRAIYAVGGLLGLAAAAVLAVMHDSPESETELAVGPRRTTESVTAG